jgi:hypothetical protein
MLFRLAATAVTALSLCVAVGSTNASAQTGNCAELYGRMMGAYQTGGAGSPQYGELYARYNQCLSGGGPGPERRGDWRQDRERREGGDREQCAGLENRERELRERLERGGYNEDRERLEYRLRETREQVREQCRR